MLIMKMLIMLVSGNFEDRALALLSFCFRQHNEFAGARLSKGEGIPLLCFCLSHQQRYKD